MKISLLLFLITGSVYAWGPMGHRIVAEVASRQLDAKTLEKINILLEGERLVDVANWPDEMRSNPDWKKANPWHYVSVPDNGTYSKSKKNPEGDIIVAIDKFSVVLKNPKSNHASRQEALKFLVHFIGDIHMPLHVGKAEDMGGNKIVLTWFGQKVNLHEIWDEHMIAMEKLSFTEYTEMLFHLKSVDRSEIKLTPATEWALESQNLRPLVYDYPKKKKAQKYWEYDYRYKMKPYLNQRLYLAGVRLALFLKENL